MGYLNPSVLAHLGLDPHVSASAAGKHYLSDAGTTLKPIPLDRSWPVRVLTADELALGHA
jgi:hypothetical protein